MNRISAKLTTRFTAVIVFLMIVGIGGMTYEWFFHIAPEIKQSEQTKADLLISPYALILQRALEEGNTKELENILNQLVLLEQRGAHGDAPRKMVKSVTVELIDGRVYTRANRGDDVTDGFVVETALFSQATQMLAGAVRLVYNGEPYQRLMHAGGQRVLLNIVVVFAVLLIVQRIVVAWLRPLTTLSRAVDEIDSLTALSLPAAPAKASIEIHQLWTAVDMLLHRLEKREREILEEHREVQKALQAKLTAESANRAKSTFLANMSHELRTPLNAIIGYSEMLAEDAADNGMNEQAADLNKIRAAGKHLLCLINDVLDLSKIEAGKMKFDLDRFSIAMLVQEAATTIDPMVRKNANRLEVQCSRSIGEMYSDPLKIKQVLINLLSNAAKFTANGAIFVRVSSQSSQSREYIRFEVTDTGIGIAKTDLDKLFEAFVQADSSSTRKFEGTGLGLALCRRLCRLLGGEINAVSEPGRGSTFAFWLPREVNAEESQVRAPEKEGKA